MSYIETPREVYKQRFDLVVREMKEKTKLGYYRHSFNLKTPEFTPLDIEKLIFILYNHICRRDGGEMSYCRDYNDFDNWNLTFGQFKSFMSWYEFANRDSNHLLIRYQNIMFDHYTGWSLPNAGDVLEKDLYECFKTRFIIMRR